MTSLQKAQTKRMIVKYLLLVGLLLGVIILVPLRYLSAAPSISVSKAALAIPAQVDWVDYGPIFESGVVGEWDYILWGGFVGTAVKKDGIYYLYYQGISGYRLVPDETVTWRTIGVATSPDGINFTKHGNNPVVTWFPNDAGEEGAASAGATLNETGDIAIVYGANTEIGPTQVNADGRLTASTDGLTFADQGIILDHTDGSLWGSGDELFPVIAFQDSGQWFVYYIPNGTLQRGRLGVAWGNSPDNLTNSAGTVSGAVPVEAWGMGGYAKVGPDTYALFINNVRQSTFEVRTVSLNAPDQLSAPVETYQFDDFQQGTVILDEETNTWFLYYRNKNAGWYGLKVAPAGAPDTTPPTAPMNVAAMPISDRQIDLSWDPATDSETGIVLYNIFRDGVKIATVKGWSFSDTGLVEQTGYNYEISAVNYHGVEGPRSPLLNATSLADVTPPSLVTLNTGDSSTQVRLVFDEPVEQLSAETTANYAINGTITVNNASLDSDLRTVDLTTSEHISGTYRITINKVRDRAGTPNTIAANTTMNYTFIGVAGLVGAWNLDEGMGGTAFDKANYGNDGALFYINQPGPTWTMGKFGHALQFDGLDDQVTIDGSGSLENVTDSSHTFAAWINPDSVPPGTTANDTAYSVLVRAYTGLYYDDNQKFRAEIQLSDGSRVAVSSGVFEPGMWHHLIMVVDDATKKLHLYVDSREVSDSPLSYSGDLADHDDAPYYLGSSEPLTNLYEYRFKGKIDEARLYNRALTPLEAQELFAWFPNVLPLYLPIILK